MRLQEPKMDIHLSNQIATAAEDDGLAQIAVAVEDDGFAAELVQIALEGDR
jgi:hypothetical protein